METALKIFQDVINYFSTNEKATIVMAYIVGSWAIITAIKFIAGFIIKLTKSTNDDAVFAKIVAFMDKYIGPFFNLLPHSTIALNKIFMVFVNIAKYIIGIFSKKE